MEFTPGSVHVATPVFSNPKSAGFDYQAVLCMGATWTEIASASFHLDAGQSKSISFSVTMPTTPGTYPVYFKVSSGGVLIGTFVATEAVIIIVGFNFTLKIINPPSGATQWVANLGEVAFDFIPAAGSPVLGIDQSWVYNGLYNGIYVYGPYWNINTTVGITVADATGKVLLQAFIWATIYNEKDYIFDYATRVLSTYIDNFLFTYNAL